MLPLLYLNYDFFSAEIHKDFIISSIKEGVILSEEKLNKIFELFDIYYHNTKFVSIAHREFDYTVDPNLLRSKKHPNLKGIAVVCTSDSSRNIAEFERKFYPGHYEIFDTLDASITWAKKILEKE
tara:strand:+ start:1511 stop:1885 length:375 start_codon:yes stop_codon:yes gene_type:complete